MKQNLPQNKITERFLFYFLSSIDSIGSETIKKLISTDLPPSDILDLDDTTLKDLGLKDSQIKGMSLKKEMISDIYDEFSFLESSNIKFLTFHDDQYPKRLRNIKNSPMVLYIYGKIPEDDRPAVSIIGARASTPYGESISASFSASLAKEGVNIVSGMAVGIDGYAHMGALSVANGQTYAVLAGGVNVIYPKENALLYNRMAFEGRGGVISENTPGSAAISRSFPMRNRIISGLSDIVLLIEARSKSGSLITVENAVSQGRTVMAVPGRVTDPMSKGANMLISNGARMANTPADILDELSKIKNNWTT